MDKQLGYTTAISSIRAVELQLVKLTLATPTYLSIYINQSIFNIVFM